ncbi:MAG: hypothetical protein JXR70_09670 [Spirochaetales bacterium]|nr:hypothetical protein [Spirochaetales bacterium]
MSDRGYVENYDATRTQIIWEPVSLQSYAETRGYDPNQLLNLNRHLGLESINDSVMGRSLIIPITYLTSMNIPHMNFPVIEARLKKIRPFIREVLHALRNFEITTRELVKDVYSEQKVLLPTHIHVFFQPYNECETTFIKEADSAYKEYKKKIYKDYFDALVQLGLFHRNMVYLYHLSHNNRLCEFKQTDATKLRHALEYAYKFLIPCLSRLGEVLNFLSLNYRMLTGNYGDYTLLQNMTDICNGFFPLVNKNFKATGRVNEKLDYLVNPVDLTYARNDDFINFTAGRLTYRLSRGKGKIFDEDLFDFGKNYESLKANDKINALRDEISKNYRDSTQKVYDEYNDRNKEATTQYYSYHIPEVKNFFTRLKSDMNQFTSQHRRFNQSFKPGFLSRFQQQAEQAIKAAERTRSRSTYSADAADKIDMMDARMEIFHLAISIFCTAAIVNDEISGLQKLWMSEEELIEQAGLFFDKLKQASENPLSKEAREALTEIYQNYQQFQDLYDDLMKSDRIFDTILTVVTLVIAIAVIVVVTVCTGGAGAVLAGGLGTLGASLTTTQMVIVVATEAYAMAVAFEAMSALIQRRNMSFTHVMEGFITNLMFIGVFNYLGKFFTLAESTAGLGRLPTTFRQIQLLKLKQALMIPAKIATMTLATIVCSAPGFLYRIAMTYNRLPDAEEWVGFLVMSALIGGAFSALAVSVEHLLPTIIRKYKAYQLQSKLTELQAKIDETSRLYSELNRKYGTTIKVERSAYDELMQQNTELLDKLRALNKGVKDLRRELTKLQVRLSRNQLYPDVTDFNELLTVDQSLDQVEALIRRSEFRNPPRYGLAVEIDNKIFGRGNANCLAQLNVSKNLYMGRIPALIEKQPQIESLLSNYDVIMGSKKYSGMDGDFTGTTSMVLVDKETREIVDEITVLDEFGDGTMAGFAPEVPLPDLAREYDWFGGAISVELATNVAEYLKLLEGGLDKILKQLDMNTRNFNHPLANLSEPQALELRRILRLMDKPPKFGIRVQWSDGTQYDFAKGPMTYLTDPIELIRMTSRKDVMINIGYNKKNILDNTDFHMVYIFEILEPGILMEPSVESIHKAFDEMVKRKNASESDLKKAGLIQNAKDHAMKVIKDFDGDYKKLKNALIYEYKKGFTEKQISDKVKELIEYVFSPSFMKDFPPEANYVLNDLNEPELIGGRIELYKDSLDKKGKKYKQDPVYILLDMLNKRFGVYAQYTNNGYTLTTLGNKGFPEWQMHESFDPKTKTMHGGYRIIKKANGENYKLSDFIRKK